MPGLPGIGSPRNCTSPKVSVVLTAAVAFSLAALLVAAYAAYVGAQWIGGVVGGGVIVSGIWALRRRIQK